MYRPVFLLFWGIKSKLNSNDIEFQELWLYSEKLFASGLLSHAHNLLPPQKRKAAIETKATHFFQRKFKNVSGESKFRNPTCFHQIKL